MCNKLNGLTMSQTKLLIDALESYQEICWVKTERWKNDFDYLLNQLEEIRDYLDEVQS